MLVTNLSGLTFCIFRPTFREKSCKANKVIVKKAASNVMGSLTRNLDFTETVLNSMKKRSKKRFFTTS